MISASSAQEYDAARRHAGLIDRSDHAHVVVSGKDRATYLHGLLTNDIASLKPGEGCYAAYLTPQGRMIADLWVYELGDVILLTLLRDVKETVVAKLDQFIFSEDVQLGDVTGTFPAVALVGPAASRLLSSALDVPEARLSDLSDHGNLRASFNGQSAIVLRITDLGEPGYDVLIEAPALESLRKRLLEQGAADVGAATSEVLRIESGIPKFHLDMDEQTIPLEAGIESRAISLTKGCYVGQEVIIRVLHRGHGRVARKLVGLSFADGAAPDRGVAVQAAGRPVGEVTSAAWSPALQRPIALAYLQRDFIQAGTQVTVDDRAAEVTALPFVSIVSVEGRS
jgi:folate-binding protein YgfZ